MSQDDDRLPSSSSVSANNHQSRKSSFNHNNQTEDNLSEVELNFSHQSVKEDFKQLQQFTALNSSFNASSAKLLFAPRTDELNPDAPPGGL